MILTLAVGRLRVVLVELLGEVDLFLAALELPVTVFPVSPDSFISLEMGISFFSEEEVIVVLVEEHLVDLDRGSFSFGTEAARGSLFT